MASQERRLERNDSRREAILDAATLVFTERGFAGASNRAIAREAGVSPGLIYWYFEDKTDLFKEVLRSLFPLRVLEFPDSNDDIQLHELLRSIGMQFMEIMSQPHVIKLIRIALAELATFPELRTHLGQMIATQAIGRLASLLDDRISRGELPPIDTHLAAQSFFGSLVAFILRKYIFVNDDLSETADESMIEITVRLHAGGLAAQSSPIE